MRGILIATFSTLAACAFMNVEISSVVPRPPGRVRNKLHHPYPTPDFDTERR